jgi:multicomponent Na+:H+ antiporter subunit G
MYTLGSIVLLIGGFFMFLGALGIVRMPDVFNKIQAGTKATTLGFLSIIMGMIILKPEWAGKLILIGFFVLLTNPIGSHNLSRAAHGDREYILVKGVDRLDEDEEVKA